MAALTRLEAIKKLQWMVSSDTYPELSNAELTELIDEKTRSSNWTANTAYIYGDIIEPTVKNGRTYKCIVAGTSGATEPSFPEIGFTGQTVSDNNIYWNDAGAAYYERYDVRAAAREGWLMKASKIAHLVDVKDGTQDLQISKLLDHCYKMAEKYRSIGIF